jgi:hypothetical protein
MKAAVHSSIPLCRYSAVLDEMHNEEHLAKFEDLLEAAVDLEKIPDEYLIAPTYDSGLEVILSLSSLLGSRCRAMYHYLYLNLLLLLPAIATPVELMNGTQS